MSAKRPARRYLGLTYEPAGATRKEVTRAIEEGWARVGAPRGTQAPRLLVCEAGKAIVAVPRELAPLARRAAEAAPPAAGGVRVAPVVTSGTVASVKERLGLPRQGPRRS